MTPPRRAHDPPLGTQTYTAGAHGLRRNPGQSVNLAHPFWRNPCAPAPLYGHPRRVFLGGAMGVGGEAPLLLGSTGMAGKEVAPKQKKAPIG
jgi:hypothetical protein